MSDDEDETDATGADPSERRAKDELFEAIDHFKNAASILFDRASRDPAVKSATKEAGKVVRAIDPAVKNATKEAEKVVRKIGDAAEPLAKQLTDEVSRLTRDVLSAVEGRRPKGTPSKKKSDSDEEE